MSGLFGHLDEDIFMVFSGSNRRLYEEVIFRIYRHFFSAEITFPRRKDIEHFIYGILAENPTLWQDEDEILSLTDLRSDKRRLRRIRTKKRTDPEDATDRAMIQVRHIYVRLVNTGWLEESHFGMRVDVDMPHGAMRLAQFLADLRVDISTNYSGLVVQIRQAVHACQADPDGQGMGLRQASENAIRFTRSLRSIFSTLKAIERRMLEATGLKDRLQTLMEDFVGQLFLRDFKELHTSSHPARHQSEIVGDIHQILETPQTMRLIARTYFRNNVHPSESACRDQVMDDLGSLQISFQRIDEVFDQITQRRQRIEGKLRSTIRYAGIDTLGLSTTIRPMIAKLNDLLTRYSDLHETPRLMPALLLDVSPPLGPDLLTKPKKPREPVRDVAFVIAKRDPFLDWLKQMKRRYGDRINVSPKTAMRFLERSVPPHQSKEAQYIEVKTLDDALALIAVRTAAYRPTGDDMFARVLHQHFSFETKSEVMIDNRYFQCAGFKVTRIDDHVTLPQMVTTDR